MITQLQQPQFQPRRDRQQFRRVRDQITDAQFQAVEFVGASRSVGANGGPEVAFVAHLAIGQALLHPLRVVGVIHKQRHLLWGQGKLMPALRVVAGQLTTEKR